MAYAYKYTATSRVYIPSFPREREKMGRSGWMGGKRAKRGGKGKRRIYDMVFIVCV